MSEKLQLFVRMTQQLKTPQADSRKASQVLNIDPKYQAKLASILNGGSGLEKGLDALAKELKSGSNGKQMLAALKKAKVVL
jgi:hypothetical protein